MGLLRYAQTWGAPIFLGNYILQGVLVFMYIPIKTSPISPWSDISYPALKSPTDINSLSELS